jgi:membrane protein YqaA with SNARE-associated domain
MKSWGVNLVAAAWGFAEATLFFLVPDVWLSFIAARRVRPALVASLFAVGGALIGGALMYLWGLSDPQGATAMLDRVPAVSREMIARVETDLEDHWPSALLTGAFVGTPYKIYAIKAASMGIGLAPFLVVSIPARLARFVLVTLIVGGLFRTVFRHWPDRKRLRWTAVFWVLFYAVFLTLMPS